LPAYSAVNLKVIALQAKIKNLVNAQNYKMNQLSVEKGVLSANIVSFEIFFPEMLKGSCQFLF